MCMFETELSQALLCLGLMPAYCSAGGGPPDSSPFSDNGSLESRRLGGETRVFVAPWQNPLFRIGC